MELDNATALMSLLAIGVVATSASGAGAAQSESPDWWNESGQELTVSPGETVTIERTIGAAEQFESEIEDDIEAANDALKSDLNISVVDDDGAREVEVDRENLTVTASWEPRDENPTLTYELSVPENASTGAVIEIERVRYVDDMIFTGSPDEMIVQAEAPCNPYVGDDGIATIGGALNAIDDYEDGDLSLDRVLLVIDSHDQQVPLAEFVDDGSSWC